MACTIRHESIASQAVSSSATVNGDAIAVDQNVNAIIAEIIISSYTDGSYTVKIQHSSDKNVWFDLGAASSALTSASRQIASVGTDAEILSHIRAVATSTSVTSGATLSAVLHLQKRK